MSKKISNRSKEEQEKMAMFRDLLSDKNKQMIIDLFDAGLEVGFFGKEADPNGSLQVQIDEGKYLYLIRRMPVELVKRLQAQELYKQQMTAKNAQLKNINLQKLGIGVK